MKVNSYNEWDTLKEVIVGSAFNYNIPMLDISFKLFFHDNAHGYYANLTKPVVTKEVVKELSEDIEGFVKALEKENIKVYRPKEIDKIYQIQTPYWKTAAIPALNVRDQAIILGDTIVETAPLIRARYFENDLLKPIFYEKFNEGSNWVQMPKPMMTDESFDQKYVTMVSNVKDPEGYPVVKNNYDTGLEMMIDGAQMVRFNKDIIVNVANRNHLLGYEWLVRNFGHKFNFHKLQSVADNHLDSYIVPLREGLLFLRNKYYKNLLPDFLKSWDIIYPPEITENFFQKYPDGENVNLAGPYIDMNILVLGNNKVIGNSLMLPILDVLNKAGMDVIPVQHRHRRIFSGGFHCFTLDLVRE